MYQYQNPMNDFYFRNAQFNQPYTFPTQQTSQVTSRFVTNIEEAKASMINPLSYNLYLDSSNGKIYLKKLGNNGQSEFITYSAEENNQQQINPIEEINSRLSNIENVLGELRNDKSVSSNADVQESNEYVATTIQQSNGTVTEGQSASISKNAGNDKWKKRP